MGESFSLDWTPEQLATTQAAAWRRWISYGVNVRRIFTAAWLEMQTTEIAVVPKAEVVTPDEVIQPGQHRRRAPEESKRSRSYYNYGATRWYWDWNKL
jgi:hypothetical protein